MKKTALLIAMLAAAGFARAEEAPADAPDTYIANLCTLVTQEKAPESADSYITKLKALDARGQSPSSLEKPEFDEDEARTVIAAWMNLSDSRKQQAKQSPEECQTAIISEYESQD